MLIDARVRPIRVFRCFGHVNALAGVNGKRSLGSVAQERLKVFPQDKPPPADLHGAELLRAEQLVKGAAT